MTTWVNWKLISMDRSIIGSNYVLRSIKLRQSGHQEYYVVETEENELVFSVWDDHKAFQMIPKLCRAIVASEKTWTVTVTKTKPFFSLEPFPAYQRWVWDSSISGLAKAEDVSDGDGEDSFLKSIEGLIEVFESPDHRLDSANKSVPPSRLDTLTSPPEPRRGKATKG